MASANAPPSTSQPKTTPSGGVLRFQRPSSPSSPHQESKMPLRVVGGGSTFVVQVKEKSIGGARDIFELSDDPMQPESSPTAAEISCQAASESDDQGIHCEATCERWLVLATFSLFGISNQYQLVTTTTIVEEMKIFFHATALQINILSAIPAIFYVCFIFSMTPLLARIGLKRCLQIGASINAIAAALKLLSVIMESQSTRSWAGWVPTSLGDYYRTIGLSPRYAIFCIGQCVAATGQLFFLGLPPLIAAEWFPETQRSVATAVGAVCGMKGTSFGYAISPLFINPQRQSRGDFAVLFSIILVTSAIPLFLAAVVPDEPRFPPSMSSPAALRLLARRHRNNCVSNTEKTPCFRPGNMRDTSATTTYGTTGVSSGVQSRDAGPATEVHRSALHIAAENPNMRAILVAYSLIAGTPAGLAAVLTQLSAPYGVTETQTGFGLLFGMAVGLGSAILTGRFVDRFRIYRQCIMVMGTATATIAAAISFSTLLLERQVLNGHSNSEKDLMIDPRIVAWLLVVAATPVLCSVAVPAVITMVEFAAEVTFPCSAVVSASALAWGQNVSITVFVLLFSWMVGEHPSIEAVPVCTAIASVAAAVAVIVFALFTTEDLRRLRHEKGERVTPIL